MASSSSIAQQSSTDEVPENLLLNPRAHVLKSASAPLAAVPSTNSTTVISPTEDGAGALSPEQEKERLDQALEHKATGNAHFTSTPPDFELAISFYRSALEACPPNLVEQITILHANIAAGFIKLEKWKEAEAAATESLKSSGEDDGILKRRAAKRRAKEQKEKMEAGQKSAIAAEGNSEGRIEELDDDDDGESVEWGKNWKARLRRAKAREMQGTWQALTDALEDYKLLSLHSLRFQAIPAVDKKNITAALTRIPPKIDDQKQKEVAEMMGKLKGLGDTILRPFGLSTNNFQMVKDQSSGGYSMNFQQNGGSK